MKKLIAVFIIFLSLKIYGAPILFFSCADLFKDLTPVTKPLMNKLDLIGNDHLKPNDPLFKFYQERIRKIKAWGQLPKINNDEIIYLYNLPNDGRGNKAMKVVKYRGQLALLKILNEKTRGSNLGLVRSARVLMELNKLGQGAEFFGAFEDANGEQGILVEYVQGAKVPQSNNNTDDLKFQSKHEANILITGQLLQVLGYTYTPDMQFILSPDGRAALIDPEYFYIQKPQQLPFPEETMPGNPMQNAIDIIKKIKSPPRRFKL